MTASCPRAAGIDNVKEEAEYLRPLSLSRQLLRLLQPSKDMNSSYCILEKEQENGMEWRLILSAERTKDSPDQETLAAFFRSGPGKTCVRE